MPLPPPHPPRLGDQLARARAAWVRRMRDELARRGFDDYRRSDTGMLRSLVDAPRSIGVLAGILGVSRQAVRKFADGLERRGYVTVVHDETDARRLRVVLTPRGERYAGAVVDVVALLDGEIVRRTDPAQLQAALAVLQSVIDTVDTTRPAPPAGPASDGAAAGVRSRR